MVQELLNYNPRLGLGLLSCFVLCFSGRRGILSEEAVRCQHPQCHSLSLRHCAGFPHCLGCMIPISPVWCRDWELSDKPRFFIHHQTVSTSPLWGKTESADGAVTVNTGESWPLLCNLLGVYLWEECGGIPHPLLGDFAIYSLPTEDLM